MFICKRSHWFWYLIFLPFDLRDHLESFDCRIIVRWIIVWCCAGWWWGKRRIPYFPLYLLALFGMFPLLGSPKVVLGWTLTSSPIAIFIILGRVALRWTWTIFSFHIISATMACGCVGCYYLEHHFLVGSDYPSPSLV